MEDKEQWSLTCPYCGEKIRRVRSEKNFIDSNGVVFVMSNLDFLYECGCDIWIDTNKKEETK